MNTVAVIGCNSFSGAYCVDALLENAEYEVIGIDRVEKGPLYLPYAHHGSEKFRFFKFDINTQMDEMCSLLRDEKPQYIINFAALVEVAPSWDHPAAYFQTNAVALTNLADCIKDFSFLRKFVQISTPEVYGTFEGKIDESAALNPSTPYAASKAAGDLSLLTYWKNFSLPVVLMRATNVYGSHQQLFKIIPRTILYARANKTIDLHGGGKAVKSYVHIKDITQGYLAGMLQGKPGEVYHLSPDQGISIYSLIEKICKLLDKDIDQVVQVVSERLGQDKAYVLDSTKARQEFGWQPVITLEEGIREVVEWIDTSWQDIEHEPWDYVHQS